MIVELTFWEEFGPFVVAVAVGLLVSGALVLLGSRAGATYEKTMVERAAHYRGLSRKLKKGKRASYEQTIHGLREKAGSARKVQSVGLYGGAVFISYHLARLVIGAGEVVGAGKWAIVAGVMVAVTGLVVYLERRGAKARRARLAREAELDVEPEEATTR